MLLYIILHYNITPPATRGTERATSVKLQLLRLQSSEGKFTTPREIEPARRSLYRRGSRTFAEVARLAPYGSTLTPASIIIIHTLVILEYH